MKILCDRHHSGLTESLVLLFQKRLGWDIYFQKGMEWFPDFWDLQPFRETAVQYLERELEGVPGITLEEFKNTKFDVLLCSVPQHVNKWIKLRDLYQPQAKLCFQVGNAWTFDNSFPIKNILASAKIHHPVGFNIIEYHEEFNLETFHYESPKEGKKIYNFINCLGAVDIYKKDWELFLELEKRMPTWEFRSYGGQNRDGVCNGPQEVADKMRDATFIFNVKQFGDGFGFTIHQAAAIGRPILTRLSDYQGKLAEPLIQDGITAITVDNHSLDQLVEILELIGSRPSTDLDLMSKNIYGAFKETVDFDKEELLIRDFLASML